MPVETDADRAAFLNANEFGEAITWTVGATPSTLTVVPYAGSLRIERDEGLAVLLSNAAFTCRSADVPVGAGKGDAVTFRGTACAVESIEADGAGMSLVRLKRTS
jgi:hypothetical protein